jgi:indolepyruvate ferredoxin oxidoreductase beta subunit
LDQGLPVDAVLAVDAGPQQELGKALLFTGVAKNVVSEPPTVLIGEDEYPSSEDIAAEIKARSSESFPLPATEMAIEAGNAKVANILMMGALAALDEMPLGPDDFFKVLEQNFHGKALELNKEVFMTGYRRIKEGGRK